MASIFEIERLLAKPSFHALDEKAKAQAIADLDKTCGFTNHQTAHAALWISNEQVTLEAVQAIARGDLSRHDKPDAIRDYMITVAGVDTGRPSMAKDMLRQALYSVDWRELAQYFAEN